MSDAEGAAAGGDPAADPTDEELFEAAAGAEQAFAEGDGTAADPGLDPAVLLAERDEYRDTLLRVKAEFDNYKKRVAREEIEQRERAAALLTEKLLVVLDACDAAIGHGATDVEPIAKMLGELLEREGLVRLAPEGELFDPNHHEAVMHEPGEGGESVVVETLRTGYEWKGRVLRPAMVKVRGLVAAQREWFEKDYYKVLGVSETATPKELTRAYRQLARELHPDANPGDAAAEERFKEVSAAYDVVGDETKRKEYDEVRKLGPMGGMGFGGPGGSGGGFNPGAGGFGFQGADIGDLLGGLFGGGGGGRRGRGGPSRGQGPQRGSDLEAELHLPFREAVAGVTTTLHLTSDMPCSTCHGSGAKPGTAPTTCQNCGGRGVLDDNQGMFSFSTPCPACGGAGSVITDPCPTCRGAGIERRPREVKVRIPAGVDDAQRIRLKGRGGAGRNGGPAGDLFVVVHVERDPVFGRDGRNLTLTVPVTFAEAVLGTKLTVPTLDGGNVTLKIPEGTPSGKVFRVKGRGVEAKKSHGDLLVTVQVAVPTGLTDEQRDAVEALAASLPAAPREQMGV